MLIKSAILERVKAGEVSLIFRRWKKVGVKAGGTQMTQRGVLGIDAVEVVKESKITTADAKAAGFDSRKDLLDSMPPASDDTDIYRIGVHWVGEDPRKALRADADLSKTGLDEIISKLKILDAGSKRGPWTRDYLQMIHDQPNTHAAILAEQIGLTIPTFKPWVRKLKALGLTESLRPGYRLSPRGEKVLEALTQRREKNEGAE
ncbi:MAG: ASCH domain-containing protein [Acidobacteria bacterium]|nr:ASCH domain-containing protein [Acidobacteriota bacterium]